MVETRQRKGNFGGNAKDAKPRIPRSYERNGRATERLEKLIFGSLFLFERKSREIICSL